MQLFVKRLSEFATIPVKGSALAAGYDLSAAYSVVIPARGKGLVKTDLAIHVPCGTYGRVAARSGLAMKHHLDVGAGVIDGDYRGNVGVILFNHGSSDFLVNRGDRVAQLILERYESAKIVEVERLELSERGHGGFGSTGVGQIDK